MKTLFILRHAKAENDAPGQSDHARPLNERGILDTAQLARHLQTMDGPPERILCSTARRTRQTLELLLPVFSPEVSLCYDDELYLAPTGTLLDQLQQLDEKWNRVMLVGHNPGLHGLAQMLTGRLADAAMEMQLAANFPTACLAVFSLPEQMRWHDLAPGMGRLDALCVGKEL